MIQFIKVLSLMIIASAFLFSASCSQDVKIYPAPEGVELSSAFAVEVEGKEVPVYNAKVPVSESIPRLNRASTTEFGLASFASFDMRAGAAVTVTCPEPVESVKILPTSFGIVPSVKGQKVTFTLEEPKHVTVEVNGDWHESLHVFANPFEENVPDPDDPNVIYFGPGIHEVGSVNVGDSTTVYIAGGAVVKCMWEPEDESESGQAAQRRRPPSFVCQGKNITLRGRGIIDAGNVPWKGRNMIVFQESEDVTLEGVILHDASPWTVPIRRCDNVHVDNIKILGWRDNSDGVDICNSRDVLVENCFMRTFDDAVVIKSFEGQGEVRNIHTRKCVIWNELAHSLSIGAEIRENVSDVLFEDCDIIHDVGRETALRIYHCDDAVISDVTFENIRVEEARRLISCWIGTTRWTKTEERGNVRNVIFRDITAVSAPIDTSLTGFQDGPDWKPYIIRDHASMELVGFDKDHIVENVLFDNVMLDGKKVEPQQVNMNEFVENVRFE